MKHIITLEVDCPEQIIGPLVKDVVGDAACMDDVKSAKVINIKPETRYYVVYLKSQQRFADGYFGWDESIHSDSQIFASRDVPFKASDAVEFIYVGAGNEPPSVATVREVLDAM